MIKKLLIAVIAIVLSIVAIITISEMYRTPDVQCAQPGYQQRYVGWDDDAGPCTYLQRVTFLLVAYLVFPFVFFAMAPLGLIVYLIVQYVRHKRLTSFDARVILIGLITIWGFSLLALILFTIFG